jgi:hypothetical protein
MTPAGNPVFVSALGIDLHNPPGIPVAGRPDQDILGRLPELKTFRPAFGRFRHKTVLSRRIKRKHQQCRGEEGLKSLEDKKQAFSRRCFISSLRNNVPYFPPIPVPVFFPVVSGKEKDTKIGKSGILPSL